MKTAIQEMIERLEKSGFFLISYDYDIFNEALEKEKEQMFHSFYAGGGVDNNEDYEQNFNEYYNETYKPETI
jgi:hypothetical protein